MRHTSVDVEPGTCYGQTDVPLRSTFEEEAAAVKEKLKREYGHIECAYCSPLSRAVRLAEYCGYNDAERDDRLLEMNFGEWEMKKFGEITDKKLQEWFDDWENVRPTGGESFMDQQRRVASFIEEMKTSGEKEAIVFCHGGVIMNALLLAGKVSKSDLFSSQPPYGGIIEIEY